MVDIHRYKAKRCRLTEQTKAYIIDHLKKHYSPEQIVGRAKIESIFMVSVEWIYQFICRDKWQSSLLHKYLITKDKRYKSVLLLRIIEA